MTFIDKFIPCKRIRKGILHAVHEITPIIGDNALPLLPLPEIVDAIWTDLDQMAAAHAIRLEFAGLLCVRLEHLDELAEEKRKICDTYLNNLNNDKIKLPEIRKGATTIWHQFVIRSDYRNELIEYLNDKDIGTIIHYPIPPHLSEAYRYLGLKEGDLPITENYANTVLSIPLYNGMTDEELDYVINTINAF